MRCYFPSSSSTRHDVLTPWSSQRTIISTFTCVREMMKSKITSHSLWWHYVFATDLIWIEVAIKVSRLHTWTLRSLKMYLRASHIKLIISKQNSVQSLSIQFRHANSSVAAGESQPCKAFKTLFGTLWRLPCRLLRVRLFAANCLPNKPPWQKRYTIFVK